MAPVFWKDSFWPHYRLDTVFRSGLYFQVQNRTASVLQLWQFPNHNSVLLWLPHSTWRLCTLIRKADLTDLFRRISRYGTLCTSWYVLRLLTFWVVGCFWAEKHFSQKVQKMSFKCYIEVSNGDHTIIAF